MQSWESCGSAYVQKVNLIIISILIISIINITIDNININNGNNNNIFPSFLCDSEFHSLCNIHGTVARGLGTGQFPR